MVEYLLREELRSRHLDWDVGSAGHRAIPGDPMDPKAEAELHRRGIAVGDWHARRLDAELLDAADLVLTAEAAHRDVVGALRPSALRRTFPLLQFAHYAADAEAVGIASPEAIGAELLDAVLRARTRTPPLASDRIDLHDPIGRRAHAFRRCADTIDTALSRILRPIEKAGADAARDGG